MYHIPKIRHVQPRKPPKSQMKTSSSRNASGNDPRPRTPDRWLWAGLKKVSHGQKDTTMERLG